MDKEKNDELYDMIPDQIKKEVLLKAIIDGNELTAYESKIALTKDGLRATAGYSSRAAKLLNIEEDLEAYAKETKEPFEKLSRKILKKFIEFGESVDCAVIEVDKSGKSKWPEKPINFSMDLGEKDD
jgi:hypothetical protein